MSQGVAICRHFASKGRATMTITQVSRSVTFDEFCEETGFRSTTTRKMIRLGILPVIRIGRRIRISRDVVEATLRGEYNVTSFSDDSKAA